MDRVPFNAYDFFGYLSPGALLIFLGDYVWSLGLVSREKVTLLMIVGLLILAYVLGHIIAQFSSWLFESVLVKRLLGAPAVTLFGHQPRWTCLKWLFRGYYRELEEIFKEKIEQQKVSRNCKATGMELLHHASLLIVGDRVQIRLETFKNLAGFARNMSFAFFTCSIIILITYLRGLHHIHLRWSVLAALAGIALFYRYLKFYRHYANAVFLSYSELPLDKSQSSASGAQ